MSTTVGGSGGGMRDDLPGVAFAGVDTLARNWWAVAIRGVAAVLFGLLTFVAPGITVATLVLLFGVYAIVDGVFHIVAAVRRHSAGASWGMLLLAGIAAIVVGICTLMLPGITALVLVYWIAAWAIVTGIAEIVAAVRLRKAITNEWLLALAGVLALIFGVLLVLAPGIGAITLALWVGAYALVAGIVSLALAFRLRRVATTRGGAPSPA